MGLRMLVVDDEQSIRWALRELFLQEGWEVHCAANGEDAVERINAGGYDFVITDLKMPGRSGLDVVREARLGNPELGFLVLTGCPTLDTAMEALRLGAWDYVNKPCDVCSLRQRVRDFADRCEAATAGHVRREPVGEDTILRFLEGAGTELMGDVSVSWDARCVDLLNALERIFKDLGIESSRVEELVQACVEIAARTGGGQHGACARVAILEGYALVNMTRGACADEDLSAGLARLRDMLHVDVRLFDDGEKHSVVLSEAI